MGIKVAVNPPKTPVTEGSDDIAASTLPGVYKLPGPPAPFVPGPLPNIGKSGDNLEGATKDVKVEKKKVAKKGSKFKSSASPDAASKGTGGGMVSATEEGKTEFTAPGSMNVKVEGDNVQVLGDAMTNDDKNGGATLPGNIQTPATGLGLSPADEKAICDAFCEALGEHKQNVKSGANKAKGYKITNIFNRILKEKNIAGLAIEPAYLVTASGAVGLLTPAVFAEAAALAVAAAPEAAALLGSAAPAAVAVAGGTVAAASAGLLSRALTFASMSLRTTSSLFGLAAPSWLGRTTLPDVTITRDGLTKALDAKFPGDSPRANQPTDFKRIDHEGKYREINCKTCPGCAHC